MGTITVRARLLKTHPNDGMRRCGADLDKTWGTYDLDEVAYKAFLADPAIQTEIVTDFEQEEDAPATVAPDVGEPVDVEPEGEVEPAPTTVSTLKAALKERGVKIPKNANKAALTALYHESQPA